MDSNLSSKPNSKGADVVTRCTRPAAPVSYIPSYILLHSLLLSPTFSNFLLHCPTFSYFLPRSRTFSYISSYFLLHSPTFPPTFALTFSYILLHSPTLPPTSLSFSLIFQYAHDNGVILTFKMSIPLGSCHAKLIVLNLKVNISEVNISE